jgi:dipeptidyl aminopeptidase/acylaminoacyl peptidase
MSTTLPILDVNDGLAISRDGSRIAFVGGPFPGRIYIREMDQLESRALAGTEGATFLEFSPDGQQVSFVSGQRPSQQLRKVALKGGLVQTVTDVITGTGPPTHTWSDDGAIFLTSNGALAQVPSTGGKAVVLAKPDIQKSEVFFSRPQVLPGGRQILLSAVRGQTGRILAIDRQTGARKTLLENAQNALFVTAGKSATKGYLIYYAEANRSLVATLFDVDRLEIKGDAVPVMESLVAGRTNAFARIVVSNTGTLVYTSQMLTDPGARHTVVWVDLRGGEQTLGAPARDYRVASFARRSQPNRCGNCK